MLRRVAALLDKPEFWILYAIVVTILMVSDVVWGHQTPITFTLIGGFVLTLLVEWSLDRNPPRKSG